MIHDKCGLEFKEGAKGSRLNCRRIAKLVKKGLSVEEVKMTSREQFEEWVKEETGLDLWRTEYPMTEWDDQQYKCHQTNLAWMAWQASRAAIEIELPNQFPGEYYLDRDVIYADELIEELEQAGLKVKNDYSTKRC